MEFGALPAGGRVQDPEGWVAFYRYCAAEVVRAARCGLRDPDLRRLYGPSDIIQSVLLKYWAAGGRPAIGSEELPLLLRVMARRRVVDKARAEKGRSAGRGRVQPAGPGVLEGSAANAPGPSQVAAGRDEVRAVKDRLPPAERMTFELYLERGWSWERVAEHLGEKPEAVRKRFRRTLARVVRAGGGGPPRLE